MLVNKADSISDFSLDSEEHKDIVFIDVNTLNTPASMVDIWFEFNFNSFREIKPKNVALSMNDILVYCRNNTFRKGKPTNVAGSINVI